MQNPMNRLLRSLDFSWKLLNKQEQYHKLVYSVLNQYQYQWYWSKVDKAEAASKEASDASSVPTRPKKDKENDSVSKIRKYSSDEDDATSNEWKSQLAWLTKAVEPALQLCRWAMPAGISNKPPPSSRSLTEIVTFLQRSNFGLQDWSLSDLTIGLYLIYLQQASTNPFEDVKGVQIFSDALVQDLVYHLELAKGAYRDNSAALAKISMLRESNVVKFVKNSSVLRPGYYIGIDKRNELVILGIRGTHTVYDLITDMVSSSNEEVTFEGYSSHFGTAEAARWFLCHEMGTIKKYPDKHEGYSLRLVGRSLGGAIASLLAIMLRKKSRCWVLALRLFQQLDMGHRLVFLENLLKAALITLQQWMTILEKEDWRSVVNLVTNAKQVVSSVQDVARKLSDYAMFRSQAKFSDIPVRTDSLGVSSASSITKPSRESVVHVKKEEPPNQISEELFIPGTLYYLKRNPEIDSKSSDGRGGEDFLHCGREALVNIF